MLSGAGGQVPERNLVEGITANEKKCRQHAQSTLALATARNPYIGYANAAELAKEAVRSGRMITDITLERKLLDEKQLRQRKPTHSKQRSGWGVQAQSQPSRKLGRIERNPDEGARRI